jgi:hypothetical protein
MPAEETVWTSVKEIGNNRRMRLAGKVALMGQTRNP